MQTRITLIKFFVFAGNTLIPLYAVTMATLFDRTFGGVAFAIFVSGMIIERAWETFKTSKEKHREEFHGDWTLALVTATYLLLFFLMISEYYLVSRSFNVFIAAAGCMILIGSFKMRFWGMAALGKQWAVHAVGAQKIRKVRLVKIGPYKYVRHPIYLGILLEELAYPLIANAHYSLIFSALVCMPFVVIRAWTEEKYSLRRFGESYSTYRGKIGMFFPIQFLKGRS